MSLARNTLRRTLPLATILVLLIGSAARADVQCSQEALASYGPVNQFAFPAYYVDQGGEALEMCFDINDPLCGAIGPVPDPNAPLDVATGNFLPEAPYSFVTADLTLPTGGRALLVLSVLGTFGNATGEVVDGTQTAFSRVRFRVAEGAERERLWSRAAEVYPGYETYRKRTERQIPVAILERIGEGADG